MDEKISEMTKKSRYAIDDLLEIMKILRSPEGCPWDREQTHRSIRRDLLEEANRIVASLDVAGKAPPKKAWGSKVAAATLLIVFGMLIGFSIGILL